MTDKHLYIISDYKFKKHTTLERAQKEASRLSEVWPDRHFRIYKVCAGIKKDGSPADKSQKHDISTDYKNPPWQKSPTEATPKEITMESFKGKLLTKESLND